MAKTKERRFKWHNRGTERQKDGMDTWNDWCSVVRQKVLKARDVFKQDACGVFFDFWYGISQFCSEVEAGDV